MNYRIIYNDELYHHGVKGMKWGVRKADYNTDGVRSKNIFDQLDSLERQESRAYSDNASKYRSVKKDIKQTEKARVDSARNASKNAKIESRHASRNAAKYSLTHPISQHVKRSQSSKKMQQLRSEANKKREESFNAKNDVRKAKETYRTNVRNGKSAANEVFTKNNAEIRDNFDKAYYDVIDAGKLATVKSSYKTMSIFVSSDSEQGREYASKVSRLEDAEERRARFANAYTSKHYRR